MTTWSVVVVRRAKKEIGELPAEVRSRVSAAIDSLRLDPYRAGSKKLTGKWEGHRRLREGGYRIIYRVEDAVLTVTVVRVGKRADVYR